MDENLLTPTQQDPLLAMVRFQRQQGQDIDFTIPLGALAINYESEFRITPPQHAREAWQEHGYVIITEGKMYRKVAPGEDEAEDEGPYYISSEALIVTLTQKALDYERWMRKPRWKRWLLKQVEQLSAEIRAAIISLVTALITSIITVWILRLLGFS